MGPSLVPTSELPEIRCAADKAWAKKGRNQRSRPSLTYHKPHSWAEAGAGADSGAAGHATLRCQVSLSTPFYNGPADQVSVFLSSESR